MALTPTAVSDKTLKSTLRDSTNNNDTALKYLDFTYSDDEKSSVNTLLSTGGLVIKVDTLYSGNEDGIKEALKGMYGADGIIDMMLAGEGFTDENKIPDAIKDALIAEATSFGTVNGKPKDVAEIIANILLVLERYDNNTSDRVYGDVLYDETLSDDTALNRYFTSKDFVGTDHKDFKSSDFKYTDKEKSDVNALLKEESTFDLPDGTSTFYNKDAHKEAIHDSIDVMTGDFVIDHGMKDKLIAEAVSLIEVVAGGTPTIEQVLVNIAKVLERYDNNSKDKDYGDIDKDERVVKNRDLFLKNKLSDKGLKDSKGKAFSSSDFVYTTSGKNNDKSEIETLLKDEDGFDLTKGTKTKYDAKIHTDAINASIDKMTDGFTLDDATKKQLILEAVSLGDTNKGSFTIGDLLNNIAKILERYDNNKNIKDTDDGDITKDSQIGAVLGKGFSEVKMSDGKAFSAENFDFDKIASNFIGKNETMASSEYTATNDNNTFIKRRIKKALESRDVDMSTISDELLDAIIKEASGLGDTDGDKKLTFMDMAKNIAKVMERYDNKSDKNYGDALHHSALDDDFALKRYFESFADKKGTTHFSTSDFVYDNTDKGEINTLLKKTGISTSTVYDEIDHKDAIYASINRMADGFTIDDAMKDRLIAEAKSLKYSTGGTLTIDDLLNNIAKVLERYDDNSDKVFGNASKDKNLKRDQALRNTFGDISVQDDNNKVFSETNFVYDATSAEGGLTGANASDIYSYDDSKTQKTQKNALRAAMDTMFVAFEIDDATKDQLISEALSFDPLKEITLSKILENIASIVERYDNDKADDDTALEDVGDVLHDSVAQATFKEAFKDIDFNKATKINMDDAYIKLGETGYETQHAKIVTAISTMIPTEVSIPDETKEFFIAQASQMVDPTPGTAFTVGDLLENIKIWLESKDNDTSGKDVTFGDV